MPTSLFMSWDLETGKIPAPSTSFGPLATVEGKLEVLSIGWMTKFALHPEKYPALLRLMFSPSTV